MQKRAGGALEEGKQMGMSVEVMRPSAGGKSPKKRDSAFHMTLALAFAAGLLLTYATLHYQQSPARGPSKKPVALPRSRPFEAPSGAVEGGLVWSRWVKGRGDRRTDRLLRHPLIVPPRILDPYNMSAVHAFKMNSMPIVGVQPVSYGLQPQYGKNGSVQYSHPRHMMPMFVHDPRECIISKDVLSGGWEAGCVSWIAQSVRSLPGEFMMDIGANMGIFTLAAAAAGADTLSFEPMTFNSELLVASAGTFAEKGSGTVNLFKTALSNEAKPGSKVCIVRNGAPHRKKVGVNQGNGVVNKNTTSCELGWESSELVPLNTIDKVLEEAFEGKQAPCVSTMKIDVEGFETPAIMGAAKLMGGSCPPCHIQLEHVKAHALKGFPVLLDVLVDDWGYNCYIGTPTCYQNHMVPLKGPLNKTHRVDPVTKSTEGWTDGDWICRMEDYEKHPRCKKLPTLQTKVKKAGH
mmetsp:Transcript_28557/g.71887  ORF Transcript_28557/g.71887 Transcript_28557/m.71887 type:complete len:462 (-) Transcript_28557:113-1498(-)